jgi:bifunctional non-homologous end joining protein LigD
VRTKHQLTVGGRQIDVSNLEKVLYPAAGFTKAQVIDYYIRVSAYLLPHVKNRPVTLKRYPDGVRGPHFYEKDAPRFTPGWVKTYPVPRREGGADIRYILINDLPALVWCANLANLELHPFLHRAPHLDRPLSMVFDLDPGEGADVLTCREVAFLLKNVLERLQLRSFAKVSGSKGIQVYVPLNRPKATYGVTQPFARTVAELLAREHPDLVVSEMAKNLRARKVFIDWSQNSDYKTTVGVYSLRAKSPHPYVSMPVTWDELKKASRDSLCFEPEAALARLEKSGDLFAAVLEIKQTLPAEFAAAAPAQPPKRTAARGAPEAPRRSRQGSRRRFVVQKHVASRPHYDFRLEMHEGLKSWAVPKGVPYETGQKRLATATEDHPLDYLDFEGIIPEGQYGAGTVMVWDIGTYELIEGNYYKGNLRLHLAGKKLKGEWLLTKDREKNWVLARAGASMKPVSPKRDDESALTGRTIEQIAAAADKVWHSNRDSGDLKFIPPMLALNAAALPEGARWHYEIKFDGYRAVGIRTRAGAVLYSRNGKPLNERFPSVAAALAALDEGTMIDGEVVALDDKGRPSFNLLQHHRSEALVYYVFDVPAWRGQSLAGWTYEKRRELLESMAMREPLRLSPRLAAPAGRLIAAAREQGFEGLIAKRGDSVYEPGRRSGAWIKFKLNQGQELVIGGYKPAKDRFDYLLVGYYEGSRLIFNAKVRNGFVPGVKEELYRKFQPLETARCPFANLPEPKGARRGEAITAEVMKKIRWLAPELVAQIEYTEWTPGNHLRHSKFAGLREDKDPRRVVKETAA